MLTRESRRLTNNNNHLHTQLIASADKLDRFERAAQQLHRRLEERVSGAAAKEKAAVQRAIALQQQNDQLRQRLGFSGAHARSWDLGAPGRRQIVLDLPRACMQSKRQEEGLDFFHALCRRHQH